MPAAPLRKRVYIYSKLRYILIAIGALLVLNIALLNLYFKRLESPGDPLKEKIVSEIEKCEEFVVKNPGFRDGYLKLAVFYWQVREDEKARRVLAVAIGLDPNSEKTKKVRESLGF